MARHGSPQWFDDMYNNRALVPDFAHHLATWTGQSIDARQEPGCQLDVPYGIGDGETLDVFRSTREVDTGKKGAAPGKAPVLVFLHGGYWRSLDKSDFSFLAPALTAMDASVAVVNYDLAPQVSVGRIVEEARAAVVWLLEHGADHGAHPARLYVAGHSAGAHLAAMLFATAWGKDVPGLPPNVIKGGIAVSGIYDLAPLVETSMNADIRLSAESAREWSPAYLEPKVRAPLVLAVGGDESSEFRLQTELLAERWKEVVEVRPVPLPGCHHLNVIEQLGVAGSPLHAAAAHLMGLDRDEPKRRDDDDDDWKR